jgi:drug/metabolite transporter (DMT)-like permease
MPPVSRAPMRPCSHAPALPCTHALLASGASLSAANLAMRRLRFGGQSLQWRPMSNVTATARPSVPANPVKGFLYALTGTALGGWSAFVFAKHALHPEEGFTPAMFALLWAAAALGYLLVLLRIRGELKLLWAGRVAIGGLLLSGLFAGATGIFCWAGLARLDPSFAAFLGRFSPVLVILGGAVFLRERLTWLEVVAVGVMLFGGFFSLIGNWNVVGAGVVLMILSCVSGALWRLTTKMQSHYIPPMVANVWRLAVTALLLLVWVGVRGDWAIHAEPSRWAALLVGAFLGPCLGITLVLTSYRYWAVSRAAMVWMAEPLFVLPVALLLPSAALTLRQFIGGMIIMLGGFWLVWMHYAKGRAEKQKPQAPAAPPFR